MPPSRALLAAVVLIALSGTLLQGAASGKVKEPTAKTVGADHDPWPSPASGKTLADIDKTALGGSGGPASAGPAAAGEAAAGIAEKASPLDWRADAGCDCWADGGKPCPAREGVCGLRVCAAASRKAGAACVNEEVCRDAAEDAYYDLEGACPWECPLSVQGFSLAPACGTGTTYTAVVFGNCALR